VQRTTILLAATTLLATLACSHSAPKTATPAPTAAAGPSATSPDITPGDLKTRLYAFAADSMQGRKAGTRAT
jgi:hypothetical protein